MIRYIRLLFTFIKLCITNTGELSKALFNVTRELVAKNKVIQTYRLPQGLKTIDLLELFPDFEEKISSYSFLYNYMRFRNCNFRIWLMHHMLMLMCNDMDYMYSLD